MSERILRRAAVGTFAVTVPLEAATVVLLFLNHKTWHSNILANLNDVFAINALVITYSVVGLVLLLRLPRSRIGWIFSIVALVTAADIATSEYSIRAFVLSPGSLPRVEALAVVQAVLFFPAVFPYALGLLLFLYPNGEPPSKRWWPIFWIASVDAVVVFVVNLLGKGPLTSSFRTVSLHVNNPVGIIPSALYNGPLALLFIALIVWLPVGGVSVVVRLRRAAGAERQQIKWLAYVGAITVVGFVLGILPLPLPSLNNGNGNNVLFVAGVLGACIGIPVAICIAVLRYRLYDIDVVISRTLLFAAMAVFIGAVYVAIVVGIGYLLGSGGRPNLALSIVATAIVALAFQPVRDQAEKLANRVVYGRQSTPYEVLSQFSDQVAVYGRTDMLTEIAKAVAAGVGAKSASVWVREEGHLVPTGTWPVDGDAAAGPEPDRMVDVNHLGETLGAIGVAKPRGEPLTPVEEGLLEDLAAQAGPVIRNVTLNHELSQRLDELSRREQELRRSRQRLVAAQDAERRRLERNIHDGAQQYLVALAVKLRLAKAFATKDRDKTAQMLDELESEAAAAQETLAALSRGIYPPVLTERGLEPALRQEASTLGLNCHIVTRDLERHELEIEGAVYFCCLEALQNAAKHARGSAVEVILEESAGELQFSVRDRGPGFDEEKVRAGSGLKNMRYRIEALGGYVQVFSRPGQGAWIVGRVPAHPARVGAPL